MSIRILWSLVAFLLGSGAALAQSSLLQGGPVGPGHAPMYVGTQSAQPIVQDSGTSAGGGAGANLGEIGITSRSPTNTYPVTSGGNGPSGEHACLYDAPTTNASGYHYLCFDPNALGGALIDYGAGGGATALPFQMKFNGTTYQLPFSAGGILGPTTTTVGHLATWNNTTGTLLQDLALLPASLGGTGGLTGLVVGNGSSAPTAITPGTGVAAALPVNVGTAGSLVVNGGALGTPSSGTLTNATGLNAATGLNGVTPVANGGNGTATPSLSAGNGNIAVSGSWAGQTIKGLEPIGTTQTSNHTVGANETLVPCDATAGSIVITLPSAASTDNGRQITVRRVDATANTCTVVAASGTVNGVSSNVLAVQNSDTTYSGDGVSNWIISRAYIPPPFGTYQVEPWKVTGFFPEWISYKTVRFYSGCVSYNQNPPNITGEGCIIGSRIDTDFSFVGVDGSRCITGPAGMQTCVGGLDTCSPMVDSQTATASNIASLGTTTGSLTIASSADSNFAAGSTILIDNEYMLYTYVNSTTLTITARAQFSSSAVAHTNGALINLIDSPPAGCAASGPPTVNTSWIPYYVEGTIGGVPTNTVIWSQSEVLGQVKWPANFNGSSGNHARQLPFGVSYVYNSSTSSLASSSVCSGQTAPLGVPQFSGVHGWPAGASYDFSQANSCGGYTILPATAGPGVGSWNNLPATIVYGNWGQFNAANLCPAQEMRSAKVKVKAVLSSGSGGSVFIRSNGDNNNTGKEILALSSTSTIGFFETQVDLSAGNHIQAGGFQWSAPAGVTVSMEMAGCGAVTQ